MGVVGQYSSGSGGGAGIAVVVVVYLAIFVLYVAALWRIFTKAGQPGWAAIVPIYNLYVILKIAGRPGWWLLLYVVPLVNLVIAIVVLVDVAHSFGQSGWFAVGLLFLSIVFYPILGFGSSRYLGPAAGRGRLTDEPAYGTAGTAPYRPDETGQPPIVPPPPPA